MNSASRLTRDDWIAAALRALRTDGPDAVAVQPLARALNATKGSFYWHFSNREELLTATLDKWEEDATANVISDLEAAVPADEPLRRARSLFARVTDHRIQYPGELKLLAAVGDPVVAAALERVTQRRISYVAGLMRSAGFSPAVAERRALLAYAVYLGHAQLAHSIPGVLPKTRQAREALIDEMTNWLAG